MSNSVYYAARDGPESKQTFEFLTSWSMVNSVGAPIATMRTTEDYERFGRGGG